MLRKLYAGGFQVEPFPANTTPILQPLDCGTNQMNKLYYGNLYMEWFFNTGQYSMTKGENFKRPSIELAQKWAVSSFLSCSKQSILNSWGHCLDRETTLQKAIDGLETSKRLYGEEVVLNWLHKTNQIGSEDVGFYVSAKNDALLPAIVEAAEWTNDRDAPDDEEREREAELTAHDCMVLERLEEEAVLARSEEDEKKE